jgi:predicted RNase H-like HicB family nuclease
MHLGRAWRVRHSTRMRRIAPGRKPAQHSRRRTEARLRRCPSFGGTVTDARKSTRSRSTFTAVIQRCPGTHLYVGYVPGLRGAHSHTMPEGLQKRQAESLDELRENLRSIIIVLLENGVPRPETEFIGLQTVAIA